MRLAETRWREGQSWRALTGGARTGWCGRLRSPRGRGAGHLRAVRVAARWTAAGGAGGCGPRGGVAGVRRRRDGGRPSLRRLPRCCADAPGPPARWAARGGAAACGSGPAERAGSSDMFGVSHEAWASRRDHAGGVFSIMVYSKTRRSGTRIAPRAGPRELGRLYTRAAGVAVLRPAGCADRRSLYFAALAMRLLAAWSRLHFASAAPHRSGR